MSEWKKYDGKGCPIERNATVAVRLAADMTGNIEIGKVPEFYWGGGLGQIGEYRVIDTSGGVGDVTSDVAGSGARYNTGKPAMELIPLALIAEAKSYVAACPPLSVAAYNYALTRLGDFQMRDEGREALVHVVAILDADREAWQDCARVFDYGRAKYAAWNWAKGMAWSIPIGCAARHLLAMIRGEENDPESGLPHRGHVVCNLVMLLWFMDHYPEGDDRYTPPLPHASGVSLGGNE